MPTGAVTDKDVVAQPTNARAPRVRAAIVTIAPALGLYLVAVLAYAFVIRDQALPVVDPDEFTYGHLARSIADGDGFTWRGAHISLRAALYVFLIVPSFLVTSGADAYRLAQHEGLLFGCLVVFPVWVLARDLVGPRLALAPAALVLAGTPMLSTAGLLTETVAYPLATAALAAAVLALRRPGSRLPWVAFGFAALATWSRLQLVVLFPALLAAYGLDVARMGTAWRRRLAENRAPVAAFGTVTLILAIVWFAAGSDALGSYGGIAGYRPSLAEVLGRAGVQLTGLAAMAGFLPVLLAMVLATRRSAWRDDALGPLLAVFWPVAALLILESAWFLVGFDAHWGIERYVEYALPLALVMTVVAFSKRGVVTPRVLAAGGVLALALVLAPRAEVVGEQRAVYSTAHRVGQALSTSTGISLALVALAVVAAAILLVRGRPAATQQPARAALGVTGVLLAVALMQSQATWHWQTTFMGAWRTGAPQDLEWVDHHARGPVAVLPITAYGVRFKEIELFNKKITQVFVPSWAPVGPGGGQGPKCGFGVPPTGVIEFGEGCGAVPERFLVDDPAARVRFYNETFEARDPQIGRLVEVAGAPRLRSVVVVPCNRPIITFTPRVFSAIPADAPRRCRDTLSASLWLDAPGTLSVRFRGGRREQHVRLRERAWTLPAGRDTIVRYAVPAGYSGEPLRLDWNTSAGTPEVRDVVLTTEGRRIHLL